MSSEVENGRLRCPGIGRDKDLATSLVLYLSRKPTDDEMRSIHDAVRAALSPPSGASEHNPAPDASPPHGPTGAYKIIAAEPEKPMIETIGYLGSTVSYLLAQARAEEAEACERAVSMLLETTTFVHYRNAIRQAITAIHARHAKPKPERVWTTTLGAP